MISGSARTALALGALALASGCQFQPQALPTAYAATSQPQLTAAAIQVAEEQADQFDLDRQRGGMTAVIGHIQRCYASFSRLPVNQLGLRQCLVFDWFAFRFNQEVNRQVPGLGNIPFFQEPAVVARVSRYGPMAGFADPAVLGGYLAQGSNTIFAVMAARNRR